MIVLIIFQPEFALFYSCSFHSIYIFRASRITDVKFVYCLYLLRFIVDGLVFKKPICVCIDLRMPLVIQGVLPFYLNIVLMRGMFYHSKLIVYAKQNHMHD